MKIFSFGKQHIHEAKTEIFLDSEDYLCIAQYCIVCGEILNKRRIKTEPFEMEKKMTNREYLDSLSNMDFANFIYSKLLKIGKEYNDSVLGIAQWLGKENGG